MTARQRSRASSIWPNGQPIAVPDTSLAETSWQERGRCAEIGGDAWFPEKGGTTRDAKKVCFGCEVRDQCLQYALEHDERFGIWGGKSERERRKLRRLQDQEAAA